MSRVRFRFPSFHNQLTSFLGFLDLRVGATVITLFALFNKIAGIYGVIAIFQGGTFSQVSLYLYSLITLFLFLWAIKGISDEDSSKVMRYSHLFLADHMLSTAWTLYFGLAWFLFNPHDGQKPPLNEYQEGLMGLIESIESQYETNKNIHHVPLTGQARIDAAQRVWKGERGFSAFVLIFGWMIKIYFALILYSYALHLRHGTYRTLPLSKPSNFIQTNGNYQPIRGQSFELEGVEEEAEEQVGEWEEENEALRSSKNKNQNSSIGNGTARSDGENAQLGAGISRPLSRSAGRSINHSNWQNDE